MSRAMKQALLNRREVISSGGVPLYYQTFDFDDAAFCSISIRTFVDRANASSLSVESRLLG